MPLIRPAEPTAAPPNTSRTHRSITHHQQTHYPPQETTEADPINPSPPEVQQTQPPTQTPSTAAASQGTLATSATTAQAEHLLKPKNPPGGVRGSGGKTTSATIEQLLYKPTENHL
ncbi:MAG: hypothetical protein FWD55_07115 [Propionibacteriaceae bacterium]|nr:hypothetical protein [Propionibacteriaceae bacterium]